MHKSDPKQYSAREIAVDIVYDVLENGAYSNIALEKKLRRVELSSGDKKLVTEIVNGTIRMLKHLDWVLNLFVQLPLEKQNPWLRNVLRISLYQILFMDRIPEYAAVNYAVEMVRSKANKKLAGVANGVLRNIVRKRDNIQYPDKENECQFLSVYYSQAEWLVEMIIQQYGRELSRQMFEYFNKRNVLSLRVNTLQISRTELIDKLTAEGLSCSPCKDIPWAVEIEGLHSAIDEMKSYIEGCFYVQTRAAMLAAAILNPEQGEELIDLCCGLGGKSTHFAEWMKNCGKINAFDIYGHKLQLLNQNCRRLGIDIVKSCEKDILLIDEKTVSANYVFLDAPCSGLGVLGRRADLRWTKKPEQIDELKKLQKKLISKAGQIVAPGGRLVYSTCTVNNEENQNIISDFLHNNPEFHLEGFADDIDFFPLDEQDRRDAENGMLCILPGKYMTDGMFYARMRRS